MFMNLFSENVVALFCETQFVPLIGVIFVSLKNSQLLCCVATLILSMHHHNIR